MATFLVNAYIFIGILLLMAVLLQSKYSLLKKLVITLAFTLSVIWLEKTQSAELWLWKLKMMLNL